MTDTEIKDQLKRLSGLSFFPESKEAIRELVNAARWADGLPALRSAVSDWLDARAEAPKPAELRSMCIAARDRMSGPKVRCRQCDGNGWRSVHMLITYRFHTFTVEKAKRLNLPLEQIHAMRAGLGENQEIVGAAERCVCLAPAMEEAA